MFDRVRTAFHLLAARHSRRIVPWVFGTIVLIEVCVSVPQMYRRRRELFHELQHPAEANLELFVRLVPETASDRELFAQLRQLNVHPSVFGGRLYRADGTAIDRFGTPPQLSPDDGRSQRYYRDRDAPRFEIAYRFSHDRRDYVLVVHLDAAPVRRALRHDLRNTLASILLLSSLTTLGMLLVLARTTVSPLMKLWRDLQRAGAAIADDRPTHFESDSYRHADELGDAIAAFREAIAQIRSAIERRKQAEKYLSRASAEMRALFAAMNEAIFVVDRDGRYCKIAPTRAQLYYRPKPELIGRTFDEVLPKDAADLFLSTVRRALSEGDTVEVEYSLPIPNTQEDPWFSGRVSPVTDDMVVWVSRDISDRKRTADEIRLLLNITQAVNEAPDFQTALTVALEQICLATGWHYGEAWTLTADGMALECAPAWYVLDDDRPMAEILEERAQLAAFRVFSEGLTLLPNEGLPGRVWQQVQPVWIDDVSASSAAVYLREPLANACGLKAGFGVPILLPEVDANARGDRVLAILVFFLRDARSADSRWVEVISAVTAQLGSVMQQKQLSAELRALFRGMTDVILTFDSQGCCLKIAPTTPRNPAVKVAHGQLGKTLQDVLPKERAQLFIDYVWQCLNEHRSLEVEYSLDAGGETVWFSARISPIAEDTVLWVARDISDRKRAEQQMAEKDSYLRLILDSIPQQVFWKDTDLVFRGCNRNWAQAAHLDDPEIVVGKTDFDLLPDQPSLAQQFRDNDRRVLTSGSPELHLLACKAHPERDGEKIWLDINRIPVRDGDGEIIGVLGVIEDITIRKQALDALHAEREKSERLLLNVLPKPIAEQLKEQEGAIATSIDAATVLFADIVGFTPLSARLSATELVELLNEIFSTFDRLADRHQLEKIKTIGDAYMVVGGLPMPRPDHAEAIAEMALDMQAAIQAFSQRRGESFQLRIGINSGSVVAGVIGIKRFIYDLWGDTVNVASRMESSSRPGRIQVTAQTYDRLRDRYHFTKRGTIPVKGRGKMTTYWLLPHSEQDI